MQCLVTGCYLLWSQTRYFVENLRYGETSANSAFIGGVGCVENNGSCTDRPSAYKFTRSRGDNYGRFMIDYAHVMQLVTVIVC